jgi:hypothetical protein
MPAEAASTAKSIAATGAFPRLGVAHNQAGQQKENGRKMK